MCGIASLSQSLTLHHDTETDPKRIGNAIRHCGPDAGGQFIDGGIGRRHQRLCTIVTSGAWAKKPVAIPSGRYVTVYDGEI